MRIAHTEAILRQGSASERDVGRAIQCRGCGEIGRAAWERPESLQVSPAVTRLSGYFYLHHGQIACGRCQQVYRAD